MDNINSTERRLTEVGLSPAEAGAYLTVARHGPCTAQKVAATVGTPRSSIYRTLAGLTEKGLIDVGAGHGGRYSAVDPDIALPLLVDRERKALNEKERVAKQLIEPLSEILGAGTSDEPLEVIRSNRRTFERFVRLQLEAKSQVDMLVKGPFVSGNLDNPAEDDLLQRGVRVRAIYDPEIVSAFQDEGLLTRWLEDGEQVRIAKRPLPTKLALFDGEVAIVPLSRPEDPTSFSSIVIRHTSLGEALQIFFDHLWDQAHEWES